MCLGEGECRHLRKTISFWNRWNGGGPLQLGPGRISREDAFFSTELSLGGEAEILAAPEAEIWRFPISTFSKSEKGFDETVQGESVTIRWPVEPVGAWSGSESPDLPGLLNTSGLDARPFPIPTLMPLDRGRPSCSHRSSARAHHRTWL